MITKENLADVLEDQLQFLREVNQNPQNDFFYRHFEEVDCDVCVSLREKSIIYPESLTINDTTTCNFEHNENFVVLECVCRLLEKGYRPEHIELEPKWKLGHDTKGGKADIWVRTVNSEGEKESLLIVECKTPGAEYNDAWKETLYDGAQLFSYLEQEKGTKFLCLYTCNIIDGLIEPEYQLINVQDNIEFISTLHSPKTYDNAKNNIQRFNVWKETYGQESATRGLFEDDIAAYHIGKTKYSVSDLQEIDSVSMQKKYHEFATILRQHNVSGHENAFDKLVNLFLAKVVDESDNADELSFYWKGKAYDDAFRLQDRLQKLYKVGMEKFLHDNVTYIDNKDIENAFRRFKKDPDETKRNVLEMFRKLKFFTNNDFSFIDVHNEKLFDQNAEILLKIVKMLEDIKIKTDKPNQFLGDLFEGFLDQGIKQSEGQFFTPLPIVRFLISSLPLENIIAETEGAPKMIDYACGAGHFLNEYAQQIKPFVVQKKKNIRDYYSAITGIEKEYRLSKVSKVAAFMYGQDDINIVYADALSSITNVKDGTYSVLVANPPYSVKGFLETLTEQERNNFTLSKEVSDISKNNSIETFFVERAAQLLKEGGLAAIILPSSVLSNGNIYIKCREILLKYFDIVAIAEFGTGTFGKTGTSTDTMFLRRKPRIPDTSLHFRNRVNAWFSNKHDGDGIFEDEDAIHRYAEHISINYNDYISILSPEFDFEALQEKYGIFDEYVKNASKSATYKAILRKRITAKYSEEDKTNDLTSIIREYILDIEKEKLYYFLLATDVEQPVVIVKAPSDSKSVKKFLGYEWSGAKGNEGIKYLGVKDRTEDDISRNGGISQIITPLFDPKDLTSENKINTLIRKNFVGEDVVIPEELCDTVNLYRLVDLMDFKRATFDKSIKTQPILTYPKIKVKEGTRSEKLAKVAPYVKTTVKLSQINVADYVSTDNMLPECAGIVPYDRTLNTISSVTEFQKGDILVSNIRPYLKKLWVADRDGGCSKDVLVFRNNMGKYINNDYLQIVLSSDTFFEYMMVGKKGLKMPRGDKNQIPNFEIPIPKNNIQKKIVDECRLIFEEKVEAEMAIKENWAEINRIYSEIRTNKSDYLENFLTPIQGNLTKIQAQQLLNEGATPVVTQESGELISGYTNSLEVIDDIPLIVFGDHTCAIKYIDFEFVRGADGTQLIKVDPSRINLKYLYGFLRTVKLENNNRYERHFKYLKRILIPMPENQDEIAEKVFKLLSKIDNAEEIIKNVGKRKKEVLDKYL